MLPEYQLTNNRIMWYLHILMTDRDRIPKTQCKIEKERTQEEDWDQDGNSN
jgi:hypothetical protein